jgi:hypothetical protein
MESLSQNATPTTNKKNKTPFIGGQTIQRKLTVGSSNDAYEKEADTIADQVVHASQPKAVSIQQSGPLVKRKCSECEEEESLQMKPLTYNISSLIQRKENNAKGGTASSSLIQQINSTKGSGQKMDNNIKHFMESRFGADFSDVRLHTNSQAAEMNQELNAQAFTVGNDIYFNQGKYNPGTFAGKHLLAHELTHTLQQLGIQRKLIQRDWATEPVNETSDVELLDEEEIQDAISYNSRRFFDTSELSLLRDVLGLESNSATIDREFVLAVADYQHQFGETVDGMLGPDSANKLTRELRAESEASAGREMNIRTRSNESVSNVDSGGKNDIFDATLDHGNARLTLKMKVLFNFLGSWPSTTEQNNWITGFRRSVGNRWSYKILVRRPSSQNRSRRYLRNYATRVQVSSVNSGQHQIANVTHATTHQGSSVSGTTATLDSMDLTTRTRVRQTTTATNATPTNRDYFQRGADHEFGHMLGIAHISCNSNSSICYGGGSHSARNNIMGSGQTVDRRNAQPFLSAMREITGFNWIAANFRRLI